MAHTQLSGQETVGIIGSDTITLPSIVFSNWYLWVRRQHIPDCDMPGVYLLARFVDRDPSGSPADPLSENVVLIGETRTSLRQRWGAFHGAAFREGKGSHSEGHRYRKRAYPQALEVLYVAAMPSSALQWREWASMDDEALARTISEERSESFSAIDARKFKKYLETRASAKVKGPLNGAWIKFVERKLLLDFVLKWGRLPECNAE